MTKKLLFMTGSRADYSKMKSLLLASQKEYEISIFVTGMHMLREYGSTYKELEKDGFGEVLYKYINQHHNTTTDEVMAQTLLGFSLYCKEYQPDMIIIHGDRVESLAGALVGGFNNILTAHIEGGDLSGTIDENIRHAISKFSHIHFVANKQAKQKLLSMGENSDTIHIIGSPDMDIMFSHRLPTLENVKQHYSITFQTYAIALFHPVTTEYNNTAEHAKNFVDALIESEENYIIIAPNNDSGSHYISQEYKRVKNNPRFCYFPSIAFESFLVLLQKAQFLIGNSSAGIRESHIYNVPSINIGSRQNGRTLLSKSTILHVEAIKKDILSAIKKIQTYTPIQKNTNISPNNSADKFMHEIRKQSIWETPIQKIWH